MSQARVRAEPAPAGAGAAREDLVPAGRACGPRRWTADGKPVDDFLIERDRTVHVLNAPSPAATSALEIARHVVSLLD